MVNGKLFYLVFLLVIGLGQMSICQTYNPSLNISTSSTLIDSLGYVDYNTTNASAGDARFTLYGDGYFDIRNDFGHQFATDTSGFITTTFFNRKYKVILPTKKLKSIGKTGTGSKTNRKIWMNSGANSRVGTSWLPCKGIENYFILIFENTSTLMDSGCIEFYYHDLELELNNTGILDYDWVSNKTISGVTGSTEYNQKIKWEFKKLLPGEQRVVYIPMESKLRAGSKLSLGSKYLSSCSGSGTGASGVSGTSIYSAGSPHDPNSKIADRDCIGQGLDVKQTVTYTVRFQNEGNAPAVNVILQDELDLNYFDISTLEFIDSEYSYTYTVNGNMLEITFLDINLPGSKQSMPKTYTYDDTESYIQFKICTYEALPFGIIKNGVAIYFDLQPVIYTNISEVDVFDNCNFPQVNHCMVGGYKLTETNEFTAHDINFVPNPIGNTLYLEGLKGQEFTLNIYNNQGEHILSKTEISNEKNSIQLSYLSSGMYYVQLINENNNITKKVIKL